VDHRAAFVADGKSLIGLGPHFEDRIDRGNGTWRHCRPESARSNSLPRGTPVNWYQFSFLMGSGFGIPSDYTPKGKKRAANILRRILEENAKHGYGDYRAPPILQDDVADQYSFNNNVLRRFHETLKDSIDPNGIISPGRGGVWPAAYSSLRGALRE
jgi:hypothetical protein